MQLMMEARQPRCNSTAAVMDNASERSLSVPQHITPELFDADNAPLWPALLKNAEQFPTETVCVACGSGRVYSCEDGIACGDCGAVEDETNERNDLAEALLIAGSHPRYNYHRVPTIERRHLMALASHCLYLMEANHGRS
jgi:hypothetical protein